MDDFLGFCNSLVGSDCPVRDIPLFFNYSIKLQENEVDFDRHYSMILPEFIEATCRVIDKAVQKNISLVEKLEMYKSIFQNLISSAQEFKLIKEKFPLPKKNQELNLYEFDLYNQFYNGILFPIQRNENRRNSQLLNEFQAKNKQLLESVRERRSSKNVTISGSPSSTNTKNFGLGGVDLESKIDTQSQDLNTILEYDEN